MRETDDPDILGSEVKMSKSGNLFVFRLTNLYQKLSKVPGSVGERIMVRLGEEGMNNSVTSYLHIEFTRRWVGGISCWKDVQHYLETDINFLSSQDLLSPILEFAWLFIIRLMEVFLSGFQFRVESFMMKLAGSRNYALSSPSRQQMISQAAPEPKRRIKTDYVEVLDTSLTFSYNCFHSCLGSFERRVQFGEHQGRERVNQPQVCL